MEKNTLKFSMFFKEKYNLEKYIFSDTYVQQNFKKVIN